MREHTQVSVIIDLLIGGMHLGSSKLPSYWLPPSAKTENVSYTRNLGRLNGKEGKEGKRMDDKELFKNMLINQLAIFHFTFLAVPSSAASLGLPVAPFDVVHWRH